MSRGIIIREKEVIEKIKCYYLMQKNYRDLLLFSLAINTGLKLNEILELNVRDVKNNKAVIVKSISGVEKKFPLSLDLQNLIKKFTSQKTNDTPLFLSSMGKRLDRTTVYRNFKDVCQDLGLSKKISLASLRKTFGYHYYLEYKDLTLLQWLFNQNSVLETMKYIGVKEDLNQRFKLVNL